MFCSLKRKIMLLILSGLITAVVGFALYVSFPIIMDNAIKKRLVINEDSDGYKYWKDVPVPIYIHFYFFNITNSQEIWDLTSKPVLEEVGPYTFREAREKVNITWNNNGTVTYKQIRRWYYQPDRTNGNLDDVITTLNVPMVAAATKGKQMNQDLIYFALEEIFSHYNTTWFVEKTVEELLFKGYDDPLLTVAKKFMDLPYDKFGWFYARNDTDDGEIVAYTGENNIDEVDEIYSWNGMTEVPSFDPPCSMINGSAGDTWPPNLSSDSQITLFVPDICRSLSFIFLKETKIRNIKAYRFWADDTQLDNGKYNPNHKCFCPEGICLPAGAVNVSSCKFDAPAVVSYPHFLFADSIYSQGVIGMRPDPKLHRMYMDIVPEMGIPLGVAARMQINIVFETIPQISQFQNISGRTYFPIFWFSETAEAGEDVVNKLSLVLNTLPLISNIFSFFMVSVGSFLVLAAFILSLLYALGKIQDQPRKFSKEILIGEEKQ